jgi:hypothetical protein
MALAAIPNAPAHFVDESDLNRLGRGVHAIGKWANPSGWRGMWLWTGRTMRSPGVQEVAVLGSSGKAVMRPAPPHVRRDRETPQIIFIRDLAQVQKRVKRGWTDARKLPREQQASILDGYGPDLNQLQRELCAEEIAARELAAKENHARSVRDAQPGAATKGRAGVELVKKQEASAKCTKPKPKKGGRGGK